MKSFKFLLALLLLLNLSISSAAEGLTIWTSSENVKNAILKMTKQFEKEYETKITINVLNKDLTSQFKTAAMAGKGPDIFAWAHDVIGELAESGLIDPVQIPPKLKKQLLPIALNAFTYKNKIYGYPYALEAIALVYNKKLVPKAPKTMKELIKISKKLTNKKNETYGFLYDIANLFFSFPIIASQGAYIFKDRGGSLDVNNVGLANKGAITGVSFLSDLVKQKIVPSSTDYSIAMNKMKLGKLGMTINGAWAILDLRKSGIDFGVAPIPTLNGKKARPFVGTKGFFIRRSSKNKELAHEFIKNYLMSKEGITAIYDADPRGPTRKDVLNKLTKKDKVLKQFMESAKVGIPMPNVPEMAAVWSAIGSAFRLIFTGKTSTSQALKQAKKQIDDSIQKK